MAEERVSIWDRIRNRWGTIISVLTAIVFLLGIGKLALEFDARYASASEVMAVKQSFMEYSNQQQQINDQILKRFEVQAKEQRINSLQTRIWQIQAHYQEMKEPIPMPMQQEIMFLQNEIDQLMRSKND